MSEYLSAFIQNNDASLITIQNALDHSSTPVKGIIESLISLREGGILYLNHHPNEAEMEKYKGFHQYNVDERNGELYIWNKDYCINVTKLLDGFASVETKGWIMDILLPLSEKKLSKMNFLFNYKLMWMIGKIKENCVKFSYSFNTIIPPCLKV